MLRPGGRLAVLEFGTPTVPGLKQAYSWYFRAVLPRVGRLISRHGEAYDYLPSDAIMVASGSHTGVFGYVKVNNDDNWTLDFVPPQNEGVVNHDSADGWVIEHATIQNNSGAGLMAG